MEPRIATIELGGDYIKVTAVGGGGSAETSFHLKPTDPLFAALDGITSLVLAHHIAGIDVTSPPYKDAVVAVVESMTNTYD